MGASSPFHLSHLPNKHDVMSKTTKDIPASLKALIGADSVIDAAADMPAYLEEPRRRFHQTASAIALPKSVEQVQEIARWAHASGVALVPQGGNTGLVGGQVPLLGDEVIVSLTRLNKIQSIDVGAGHMHVDAGVSLHEARAAADEAGALFPLSIASEGTARIGGVLSSNAGGVQVLAYGNARALCLGVEAVLSDGRLYQGLNALRKDNTGYDLRDLLIGAEGTLGIITSAVLKLFPKPEGYETALIAVDGPDAALDLFNMLHTRAGSSLTAFELLPRIGIDIQLKHDMLMRDPSAGVSPWYVLAEISRPIGGNAGILSDALEAAFEAELVGEGTMIAQSESDRQAVWRMREQLSDCQSREGASIKNDVSVPVASVPELLTRGIAAVEKIVPGIRPVPFGHMGDGNIHFNLSQPIGADPKAFMEGAEPVHEAIHEIVLALDGSISAEHGIGQLKTELLQQVKDPVALEMMRAIKQALDPKGILNPGKVLGR